MPSAKTNRGRPKGTGLDDRVLLQSIIQLIEANPDLKPTTAIRSIGISNPSAIRRLRDKFNVAQASTAKAICAARPASARTSPARSIALNSGAGPARTAPPQRQAQTEIPSAHVATLDPVNSKAEPARPVHTLAFASPEYRQHSLNWFSMWTELGLQSMAVSLRTQWLIYDHVLRSPPVQAAISNHTALTDFAAAWCATSPDPGKTLH